MAVTIDNPEVEQLARELAKRTGESVDDAVAAAIRERLERSGQDREKAAHEALLDSRAEVAQLPVADSLTTREIPSKQAIERIRDPMVEEIVERMRRQPRPDPEATHAAIREIQERLAKLPVLDPRSPDELLGYDEYGLPH
jgi:antitoxin VapB